MVPKKEKKKSKSNTAFIGALVILLLAFGALGFFIYTKNQEQIELASKKLAAEKKAAAYAAEHAPPKTLVSDSVQATVAEAARKGWIPCPGNCLKLATPGWIRKKMDNFPDNYVWFPFKYEGGTEYYSQNHLGHIIKTSQYSPAKDTGICPICAGTGWVPEKTK